MIKQIINKFIPVGKSGEGKQLARSSAGVFLLNVFNVILLLLVNILLTRKLGKEYYGAFVYAFTWVELLMLPAALGMEKLLVREVSKFKANDAMGMVKGVFSWSNRLIFGASVLIALIAFGVVETISNDTFTKRAVQLALIAVPFYALTLQRQAIVQGLKDIIRSQLPPKIIKPAAMLALLASYLLINEEIKDPLLAVTFNIIAIVVAFGISHLFYFSRMRKHSKSFLKPTDKKILLFSGLSLLLYNAINLISAKTDILMLEAIEGPGSVGVYNVALKLSGLLTVVLASFNVAIAPSIAEFHAKNKHRELQNLMIKTARAVALLATPAALALIIGRNYILSLFGEEYIESSTTLIILVAGYVINFVAGSVGYLLVMTRNEKLAIKSLIISTIVNITLNFLLIPMFSIEGAAYATAASIIVHNMIMFYFVKKSIGINPTAFGRLIK